MEQEAANEERAHLIEQARQLMQKAQLEESSKVRMAEEHLEGIVDETDGEREVSFHTRTDREVEEIIGDAIPPQTHPPHLRQPTPFLILPCTQPPLLLTFLGLHLHMIGYAH